MELDRVPLWRGDHVEVRQVIEDFARYLYLPRLKNSGVLLNAISDGVNLLTWSHDSYGFADSFDESAGRYKGLRGGIMVSVSDPMSPCLLVKPEIASKQLESERAKPDDKSGGVQPSGEGASPGEGSAGGAGETGTSRKPNRYHGTVLLDSNRVGRDAGRIAEEVISHLVGLMGASVTVTLEIQAEIPEGTPDNTVRTVTENARVLKFTSQGFEID